MGSEVPDDSRIFFKDKQNELKGPFTERQVQEWYRKGWFDSSFPFYFATSDEQPNEETESLTLDTLRSFNGIGCPFASNKVESNNVKREEKLVRLEKELVDLSKKCDEVKQLEKRVEDVEKRLEELATQLSATHIPATVTETVVVPVETELPAKPYVYTPEWIKKMAVRFVHVCDLLRYGKILCLQDHFSISELSNMPVEVRLRLITEVMEAIGRQQYFFCSFCDRFMFTAHQTFMHIGSPEHIDKIGTASVSVRTANMALIEIVGRGGIDRLYELEADKVRSQQEKWSSMSLDDPSLRPLAREFSSLDDLLRAEARKDGDEELEHSTNAEMAKDWADHLLEDEQLMMTLAKAFISHIKGFKTRCLDCKLIFDQVTDYYDHLTTFNHIRNANTFDFATVVLNMQRRIHAIEKQKLPLPQ